jgi:FdhD protein
MSTAAAELDQPVFHAAPRRIWRCERSGGAASSRVVAEEAPIAFAYQGMGYAVMMATPADLEDFAVGFSFNEGVIRSADEIEELDIVRTADGVILRIALTNGPADAFWQRRRYLSGPSGCGLCGLETLAQAVRRPRRVTSGIRVSADAIGAAMTMLPARQTMNRLVGALHAAAFWTPHDGFVAVREDVGRHNALDKLTGAVIAAGRSAAEGAVLLTSRVSVEMVQKTASLGAAVLVAISAPTALALRVAEAAGITLIAVARRDGFETFTHPHRLL